MQSNRQKFWSVSGGDGGIGKSFLTAFLGISLARAGKSVIVVDARASGSNLQGYLGIKNPRYTLEEYLEHRVAPESIVIQTPQPGLRAICGAGALLGIASPNSGQEEKIVRLIGGLNAEYILVDLGTGAYPDLLDFFNMSDEGIVIVNPDPTAMHNAYEFVRSAIYRKIQRKFGASQAVIAALREFDDNAESPKPRTMIDFFEHLCVSDASAAEEIAAVVDSYRPHIVVNMASAVQDQRVAEIMQSACKKFLNVDLRIGGIVLTDPAVREVSARLLQVEHEAPDATAPQHVRGVMLRILNSTRPEDRFEHAGPAKVVHTVPAMGLNDNLMFKGCELHVQTEDMGQNVRCITTQVFLDGKIILSTKLEYPADLTRQQNRGQVIQLMRKQHFDMIRDIKDGKVQASLSS